MLLAIFIAIFVIGFVVCVAYFVFVNTIVKNLRNEVAQLSAQSKSDLDHSAILTAIPVPDNTPKFGEF